jgi:hypothetical protein
MKRKAIKRRKRLEGQIEALAKRDPEAAQKLAQYGKVRSELEEAIWHYLFEREACQDTHYEKTDPGAKEPTRSLELSAIRLCELFLDAVERRDGEALRTIAAEVEGFKRYSPAADTNRAHILCLKNILDERGGKMTIARLAALLNRKLAGDPLVAPPTQDSHSQLRNLARTLKFPIAKDKRGPRKIAEK